MACVPDGLVAGSLEVDGRTVALSGWRGTVGLGRRARVDARPGRLTADVPAPRARLRLSVTTDDEDPVTVLYADPRGGTRTVRHAALASVELTLRRPGNSDLTLSSGRGAYEYATRQDMPQVVPLPLPEG